MFREKKSGRGKKNILNYNMLYNYEKCKNTTNKCISAHKNSLPATQWKTGTLAVQ